MTKQETRNAIKQAMVFYTKPIKCATESTEIAEPNTFDDYTEQSMCDGENRIVRTYHHRDGHVGPRQF